MLPLRRTRRPIKSSKENREFALVIKAFGFQGIRVD